MNSQNKNKNFNWNYFNAVPVVGILRNISHDDVMQLLPICESVGLKTLEITMNSEGVGEIIKASIALYGGRLNIGAGTVCDMEDLEKALNFGANFIVTPNLNPEVIKACVELKVPIFSGAYTPTEIYTAWKLGASLVKVFPADQLGPQYIKNVLAPFNDIKLLPTGGIGIANAKEYLNAGAVGLGVSTGLFDKQCVANKNWEEIKGQLELFVTTLK